MKKRQLEVISSLVIVGLAFASGPLWAQHKHSVDDQSADTAQGQNDGSMNRNDNGVSADMGEMMQHMMHGNEAPSPASQDVFTVVKQVVDQLRADPNTDWEKVDIDGLREHLIDMNQLALYAKAEGENINLGIHYLITGEGRVLEAIQRMVASHAAQVTEEIGWLTKTQDRRKGVSLTVTSDDPAQIAQIRALGFMGFMVLGEHHEDHHLIMAGGASDHSQSMDHGSMHHSGN